MSKSTLSLYMYEKYLVLICIPPRTKVIILILV
eukprot:CAMPEP_0116872318 /NCGR_PEP_ID=MMETSP0463-20121206/3040_1 /TAXON_ID=181622 /ORGANISM="Strombidinopsis sp, Strain SopsisLIS2011" /LENGTH=32 /DNA_ID= /DNA_START= /DNA_END= /DNA_ORIENTATION=